MIILYDIIFILFALCYLPIFFVKIQQAEDKTRLLHDRCGLFTEEFKKKVRGKRLIWLHAVSVGEVMGVRQFLSQLRKKYPAHTIVLSTVTPTGNRVARKIVEGEAHVFYLPLDISFITRKVINLLRPEIIILMETEVWPNLILAAHAAGSKIAIVNGRISSKSFKSYYRVKGLLASVFDKVDLYLMQTDEYAARLTKIGIPPSKVIVTGNMKFDNVDMTSCSQEARRSMRTERGFKADDLILVAASTHRGEEQIMLGVYAHLRQKWPALKLLIAPRHIERTGEISALVEAAQFTYSVANAAAVSGKPSDLRSDENFDVYLLNTIGELKNVYAITDVVFMGGSFIKHGGQNPLEAMIFRKPIITGPHVFNFTDIYNRLCALQAVVQVDSKEACCDAIDMVLANSACARTMVERSYLLLQESKGATERNVRGISKLITV